MAVAIEFLAGYPRFQGNGKKRSAEIQGVIAWADIDAYYLELFPAAVAGLPQLPTLFPGTTDLYAADVSFEPFLGEEDIPVTCATVPTYTYAKVDVKFSTDPYDNSGDQIITRAKTVSGEFLTYKNSGIQWHGPPAEKIKEPDTQSGKLIPMEEYRITLHRVTSAYKVTLDAAIDDLIGKVNEATFEGAPIESLLFLGGNFTQTVTAGATKPWQVELLFSKRIAKNGNQEVGWNYLFREETGKWERVETTNGDKIYPTGDFTQLYS